MKPAAKPPVELITLTNGTKIMVTGYDCDQADAECFASRFRAAFTGLPELARFVLDRHWIEKGLNPVLTQAPPSWGRFAGFASASPDATGIHCWSGVLKDVPPDYLEIDLAHELIHMLFIALGEPYHTKKLINDSEFLVAAAQENLDMDLVTVNVWKERHLDLKGGNPRRKPNPLYGREAEVLEETHQSGFRNLAGKRQAVRQEQSSYFAVATEESLPELLEIARTGLDKLREALRKKGPEQQA